MTRQTNMELLRITAMYIILIYHAVARGLIQYRIDTPILGSLYVLLLIGVILFLLISGWFGIKPSVKGFLRLYLLLVFYKVLMLLVFRGAAGLGAKEVITLFFPFSGAVGHWWFFRTYILLFLISPVLNYLKGGGMRNTTLLILGGIIFWFSWIWDNPNFTSGKNIVNFAFIYLLGDWLRETFVITEKNRKNMRMLYLVLYMILAAIIGFSLYFASPRFYQIIIRMCYRYDSPILILMSTLFFLLFTTFNIKSKSVNWVASSAVAVYAIHECKFFDKKLWYGFIEKQYLTYGVGHFFLVLIGECIVFFLVCILIDKVRLLMMKPVNPLVEKVSVLVERISVKTNNLYQTIMTKNTIN